MEINTLGAALSFYRQRESLLMEQICDGLCSLATLGRIEQGERIADSLLGELLLERIGKEVDQFELLLNDEDYALMLARRKIQDCMHMQDYGKTRKLIEDYRVMEQGQSHIHEQFCLYHEIMIAIAEGMNDEKIGEMARQALQMTKTLSDRKEKDGQALYTQTEMNLIILLAEYGYLNSADEAEKELCKLLRYVKFFCTERRKEETGISIIWKLLGLMEERGDRKKALAYIEEGIALISQGRGIIGLEKLHFRKAQMLMEQYDERTGWSERKQTIQRECLMAYCICEVMRLTEEMEEIEKFCEEKMAWQITTLEISSD